MTQQFRWTLPRIEERLCDLVAEQFAVPRERLNPGRSFVGELGFDSLDLTELFMSIEELFALAMPRFDRSPNDVYKAVFYRQPFRVADLAELIYLQQGTGTPQRAGWRKRIVAGSAALPEPFTQLDGRWNQDVRGGLYEPLAGSGPFPAFRRHADGMRCVRVPSAAVEIGSDAPDALPDERPHHVAELDTFLIDAEPVSTTAYCRFLNSIGENAPEVLGDWFVPDPADDRNEHVLVALGNDGWEPLAGLERRPMIMVSWLGANAYSRWANGHDWRNYAAAEPEAECFLPSEAQWEYAARGARRQPFPWGEAPPDAALMRFGQHERGAEYRAATLPLADVNEPLGVSPFGLRHMAGNVWQWCQDWYDPRFFAGPDARRPNPVNRIATGARSERGGSWIGPAELCRSSCRRGRPALARGRCLGFRCVGVG